VLAKQPAEGAWAAVQGLGPGIGGLANAWGGQKVTAQRCQARFAGQGGEQRQAGGLAQFMNDQVHQVAVAPLFVVPGRHIGAGQQQMVQQGRHHQRLALPVVTHLKRRLQVQAAGADPAHHHAVAFAGGNPYAAVGRNHPGAVIGFHLHQATDAVEELRPSVHMGAEHRAGAVVGTDGQDGTVSCVDGCEGDVEHGAEPLAEIR